MRGTLALGSACAGVALGVVLSAWLRQTRTRQEAGCGGAVHEHRIDGTSPGSEGGSARVGLAPSGSDLFREDADASRSPLPPQAADGARVPAPPRRGTLRSGVAIRGLQYTYLWSDDALDPPIDSGAPQTEGVMRDQARAIVAAAARASRDSTRRQIDVETEFRGSTLREQVFQLALVESLGSGFVVYPGRDIPLPAEPEASFRHSLGGEGWGPGVMQRIEEFEAAQAERRLEIVGRAVEVARERSTDLARRAAALWIVGGHAHYVGRDDAYELSALAEEWRRLHDDHVDRIRRALR